MYRTSTSLESAPFASDALHQAQWAPNSYNAVCISTTKAYIVSGRQDGKDKLKILYGPRCKHVLGEEFDLCKSEA